MRNGRQDRSADVRQALARLVPRIPEFEAEAIVDRTLASPGLRKAAPENAAWLALVSYVRHVFTEYDALLDDGYDRDSARHFALADLNDTLAAWGACRSVAADSDTATEDDLRD